MNSLTKFSFMMLILALTSCSVTKKTTKPPPSFRINAGIQKGGIIANTDFTTLENTPPDGFTGANSKGIHAAIHYEYFTSFVSFETGLDLLWNKQTFNYSDIGNNYVGVRQLFTTQFRVPLFVNMRFLKGKNPEGMMKFKLGISPGLSMINQLSAEGSLPDYSTSSFSLGPAMAIELSPFRINEKYNPGLYFGLFRSAQAVYNDFYQVGDMPALSYMTFGITWKLN